VFHWILLAALTRPQRNLRRGEAEAIYHPAMRGRQARYRPRAESYNKARAASD
jgi:hypothetical protein